MTTSPRPPGRPPAFRFAKAFDAEAARGKLDALHAARGTRGAA